MKKLFISMIASLAFCGFVFADEVSDLQKKLDEAKAKIALKEVKPNPRTPQEVVAHLQDISVTIVSQPEGNMFGGSGGEGSGEIKTRKRGNDTINFVWTAAHVVDNLRKQRTVIDPKTGTPKIIVEFSDAKIVKSLVEDGRAVGKLEMFAEVIRFSSEEDLALLRVRKKNFVSASAQFYLDEKIPEIGTSLLHVGSLLGQLGSNSMTTGIMSQHGRLINKKIFDQTTVAAFPGSSGGGVYLTDGRFIGMVVRGAGETFNLVVPVRRMKDWAKQANVLWAMDDAVPVPSEEVLRKLPIEDIGATFTYSARVEGDKPKEPEASPPGGGHPHGKKVIFFGKGDLYLGELEEQYPTLFRLYPKNEERKLLLGEQNIK